MSGRKQANFLLSVAIVEELKRSVEKREQSRFVETALKKELKRLKLEKTLQLSLGAWQDKDQGAGKLVRDLRKSARGRRHS